MKDYILGALLVLVIAAAWLRARKKMRAGGGCCSGGGTIRDRKQLSEPVRGSMTLTIGGMHCDNCAARLQNALNRLPGVLAEVSYRKGEAAVRYSARPEEAQLRAAVEKLGYTLERVQDAPQR